MSRTSFFKNKSPVKGYDPKAPLLEQQNKISQQHDYGSQSNLSCAITINENRGEQRGDFITFFSHNSCFGYIFNYLNFSDVCSLFLAHDKLKLDESKKILVNERMKQAWLSDALALNKLYEVTSDFDQYVLKRKCCQCYPFSRFKKRLRDATVLDDTNDPVYNRIRNNILTILPARDVSGIMPGIKNLSDCLKVFSLQLLTSLIILVIVLFLTVYLNFTGPDYTLNQLEQLAKDVGIVLLSALGVTTCVLPGWFLARDLCIKKRLQFVFNECHYRAEFTGGIDNREALEAFLTQAVSAEATGSDQRNESIAHPVSWV